MCEILSRGEIREKEHAFLLRCIEVYRSLPSLWNIKSDEYKDRTKKAISWNMLLEVYQERFPTATEDDVRKRFNSMRTNFRSELKKVEASKQSAVNTEDMYVSTKWFYNAFASFLTGQETPAESVNTIKEEIEDFYCYEYKEQYEDTESSVNSLTPSVQPEKIPEQIDLGTTTSYQQQFHKLKTNKKRKTVGACQETTDELLQQACSRLQPASTNNHIAAAWAHELEIMEPLQQAYAKKFISEILFEGQMGTLHRHSVVINQPVRELANTPSTSISRSSGNPTTFHLGSPHNELATNFSTFN